MKVLVCGSRNWHDPAPVRLHLKRLMSEAGKDGLTVIHGNARGADTLAAHIARNLGCKVISVPADWGRYGRGAGPIRNQQMLDEHQPETVVAFRTSGKSGGTDDMINRARSAGLPVLVVSD